MSMAYAVKQVLDENATIWNGVPAMVAAHGEFKANLTALESTLSKQVADITGHAKDKAAGEEAMIAKTLSVGGGVMALATVNGDNGLAEAMNLSPSELRRYRDSVVAQRCMGVHDAAVTNAAALVTYGITAADIDYVHGDEIVDELGRKPGNVGFYLPPIGKDSFFKTVILDGALPRKTFSMGHAKDKRFYMECRRISA